MNGDKLIEFVKNILKKYELTEDQKQDIYVIALQNANTDVETITRLINEYIANIKNEDENSLPKDVSINSVDVIVFDMMDYVTAQQVIRSSIIDNAFSLLSNIEREILKLHFGFDGSDEKSVTQISELLHITPEDVKKNYQIAITKCRNEKDHLFKDVDQDSLLFNICMVMSK